MKKLTFIPSLFAFFAVSLTAVSHRAAAQGGLDQAESIDPFLNGVLPEKTPRTATGNWALVNAFPNLTFIDPVQMLPVPGTNQLMMVEKNGRLAVFENDPTAATKTVLFDISGQVESSHDSGMMGLAFHPEFGQAGSPNRDYLYVYYRYTPNPVEKDRAFCRLSRFTWQSGAPTIDTTSEFVLINQYDRHNWHNGGGIFFGLDSFLYVSIGDEGGANDQFDAGQRKDRGLFGGALRIDVDQDLSRSHPIRRQPLNGGNPPAGYPDSYTQGYTIPNDNPWQSPDGSELEEFYAIGFRSPHRMTLDPVTNRIWMGDVGQGSQEEISLVEKGGNLQWPYREGNIGGPKSKPDPLIGVDQPPVWAYSRAFGGCVIGGYVYRGSAHPDLQGKYIFGDHNNGILRAMTYIPGQVPQIEDLVTMASHGPGPKNGLGSFGIDAGGEIYVLSLAGTNKDGGIVYKFEQTGSGTPEPPALLSQTGAFQDLASLTPNPGVVPYDLVQPLWSDGADKKRWIAVPNDGSPDSDDEQIGFTETGEWTFPVGTVLIKHFEIAGRRLETRLLVHGNDGIYYGVTYKWRPDNSEADLLPDPPLEETIDLGGGQSIDWHFPGRTECFTCHTAAAGTVLGPKTRHLNRDLLYPRTGRTANQITTLNQLGFFSPAPDEADIPNFLTAANVNNLSETLDRRARSYLDINCSQCHRPGGPTQAVFDTLLTTPPSLQNMVNIDPINNLGVAGAKIVKPQNPAESVLYLRVNSLDGCCAMPPLAKNEVDTDAVQAIFDWINSLDPNQPPPGEPGLEYEYYEGQFTQLPNFSALDPDETGIVPNFDLRVRNRFNDYALRFLGSLHVPSPGDYTLYLTSDDGSRLWLDGSLLIDNDGNHGAVTVSATINLAAGAHALEVGYFQGGSGSTLSVEIEGPGLTRQPIPDGLLTHGDPAGGVNLPPDLTEIPDQSTETGQPVNLTLSASDPENDPITFTASDLPPGLSLNSSTGAITGSPTTAAVYNVMATASDGRGNADNESFTWTITDPPIPPEPGLVYNYYERDFTQLPDFSNFAPDKTGVVENFDLSPRMREDGYAFQYLGQLEIATAGDYTFHLSSDDGSQLSLDGSLVLDNDGQHSMQTVSTTVTLAAGVHPIEVAFFEYRGSADLVVEIEGPGLARQPIPDSLLSHSVESSGNQPPNLSPIADQITEVGQAVSLSLAVDDPENDTLTFGATGLPAGLSIDTATGVITGTPAGAGFSDVTVTVTDGNGGGDTEFFRWMVMNPPGGAQPGLRYEYYQREFTQLPDFSIFAPDKTGMLANFDLSPRLREHAYAFRFLGDLNIATAGDYTLYLTSDDGSRLWLDNVLVVDNDGQHSSQTVSATVTLTTGAHPLEVAFFEYDGGSVLTVEIEGPGLERQPIPDGMLTHRELPAGNQPPNLSPVPEQTTQVDQPLTLLLNATDPENDSLTFDATGLPTGLSIDSASGEISGTPTIAGIYEVTLTVSDGNGGTDTEFVPWTVSNPEGSPQLGLIYEYYHGSFTELPNFSTLTPVKIGSIAGFDLSPRLRDDAYAFRYVGDLRLPETGDYTFHLTSDDGSRLWIGGALIINNDGQHAAATLSATINLAAGVQAIEVGFFENFGAATLSVEIEGPGLPRQPIPATLLTHTPAGGSEAGNTAPLPLARTLRGVYGRLPEGTGSASLGLSYHKYQPDNWIGTRQTYQQGDGVYNTNCLSQTVTLKFPARRSTRSFYFTVQNDRRVYDSLTVSASRRDRKYRPAYLRLTSPPINVTAAITTGQHRIENLAPDGYHSYQARMKPSRRIPRRRGNLRGVYILSTSDYEGLGEDRIKANLKRKRHY